MSVVDACMTIFLSDAIETFVWKRGFHPTVASVRPRLRSFEAEICEILRAAGLKPDAVKGDGSDESDDDEGDSIAEKKSSEMEAFNKCVKTMRNTIYPKILSEMQRWDERICISVEPLNHLFRN
jgi:hypothetical protein